MTVSGLADGFLAGFNTMDRFEQGQEEEARANREMGLRDAMWQNQLAQQRLANQRDDDERNYQRTRQAGLDTLYRQTQQANMAHLKAEDAREAVQAQQQTQEFDWKKDQVERAQYQQKYLPLFQMGLSDLLANREPPAAFWQAVQDPRAGQYNPALYADPAMAQAGRDAVSSISRIMQQVKAGKLTPGSQALHDQLNNPQLINASNLLLQHEIRTGIGEVDPATGKTITDKQLDSLMLTPDGNGLMLGLKVTYDDGSTAVKPVTQQRSARPDDTVRVLPTMDVVGTLYQRGALAQSLQPHRASIEAALGMTDKSDLKAYRDATLKNMLAHSKQLTNAMTPQEQAAIRDDQQRQQGQLDRMYGMSSGAGAGAAVGTDNTLSGWVGNDPQRQAFVKELQREGHPIMAQAPQAALDKAYQQWLAINHHLASSLSASTTPATSSPDAQYP